MRDWGNEYDGAPPAKLSQQGGRPADAIGKAAAFILESLAKINDQLWTPLLKDCQDKAKVSYQTAKRALESLEGKGEICFDGGMGTGKQRVVHLVAIGGTHATCP